MGLTGKHQQSRNTNLVNIADNLDLSSDDLHVMPNLLKRSFSSSHLESAAELMMNRAHVHVVGTSKVSRNVLNNVDQ